MIENIIDYHEVSGWFFFNLFRGCVCGAVGRTVSTLVDGGLALRCDPKTEEVGRETLGEVSGWGLSFCF